MIDPFRVLSWGVGVQSTTLGEMSAQGKLPRLDAIITADTGWERRLTYQMREFYRPRWEAAGIPVYVVSAPHGSIRDQARQANHIHMPFWTATGGPLRRQCTGEYKVEPIKRKVRELIGWQKGTPPAGCVELWLGISVDEWTRAKPNNVRFMRSRWPLLEKRFTRDDCIKWLQDHGLPVPIKSSCIGCPYRSARQWLDMRQEDPEEWADACAFDTEIRHLPGACLDGVLDDSLYIWRDSEPLAEADLELAASRERRILGTQLPLFLCESGFCGM